MPLTLDELRTDSIRRWKAAYGRIAEVEAKPEGAVDTVYTQYPAYALSSYTATSFKPGARVAKRPSPGGGDYVFRRDADGRPLHVQFSHPTSKTKWKGRYRYDEDEVEHLEVCMTTGVPSLYNRLILSGGSVLAEQRFVCNGGGSDVRLKGGSAEERAARVLGDPHAYFLYLTLYHLEDGLPTSGEELHEVGGEVWRPTLEHEYAAGELQRIVQHWPDGSRRTVFAKKTKTSIAALSRRLSAKIADAVLARVEAAELSSRLVALELSYRDGDRHVPVSIPLTEEDQVGSLALGAEIDPARWLELDDDAFAVDMAQLEARIEASSNPTAMAKMLRKAAKLVTERGGFVAYAIDWELEGDDIAKILKQCGASAKQVREWKKTGLI